MVGLSMLFNVPETKCLKEHIFKENTPIKELGGHKGNSRLTVEGTASLIFLNSFLKIVTYYMCHSLASKTLHVAQRHLNTISDNFSRELVYIL